ncbi:MAG: hypothetical protein HKN92_00845 [Chitinophagales bacterium]|nr:hypothetical protein [Chitinophagales bacterium]
MKTGQSQDILIKHEIKKDLVNIEAPSPSLQFPNQSITIVDKAVEQGTDLVLYVNEDLPQGFEIKIIDGSTGSAIYSVNSQNPLARTNSLHITTTNLPKGEYVLVVKPDNRPLYTFKVL